VGGPHRRALRPVPGASLGVPAAEPRHRRDRGALTLRYFFVAHEWKRSVEAEARSRIRALQARIRPHFLFTASTPSRR